MTHMKILRLHLLREGYQSDSNLGRSSRGRREETAHIKPRKMQHNNNSERKKLW